MAAYEYRIQGLQRASAQVAGEVCEALANSEVGLSPASLLDASRDENAPLHGEFEWRDDVAAEKYRMRQAQGIIQNLRIVVTREDGRVERERSFVVTGERTSHYVALSSAMTNDAWREALLKQARADAEMFTAKYRRLEELVTVIDAMGNFLGGGA